MEDHRPTSETGRPACNFSNGNTITITYLDTVRMATADANSSCCAWYRHWRDDGIGAPRHHFGVENRNTGQLPRKETAQALSAYDCNAALH
mmetsp:Transcript_81203/g.143187  ORF Transcript_81203/g.143187 Transcript_81203/m.143187 type:complete len:91 (-) Transcript_81203:1402-1674(-)